MKKILAFTLAVVMALSLAACGTTSKTAASASPSAAASASPAATTGDALKIAIVTSPSGVDDGSFNQACYDGIQSFIKTHPNCTVTPVQEKDINNAVTAVSNVVADYDVIVTPGFQFGTITSIAQDNPTKLFILVDSFPTDTADSTKTVAVDNIYAMQFSEQESGFFAGISAAMETKTNKVAVVNGIAYPSNVNYQFGFEAGVKYANAKLGTKAEVVEITSYAGTDVTKKNIGGNYIGNFNDPDTGKIVGAALIAKGVDILFVAAGNSGNGVFTAAKEAKDVKVIGCDVDQYNDGVNGDSNIVLTSVLKNMAVNVERQLTAISDKTFKGGNFTLQADTDSTGYVSEKGRQQLSDKTLAALKDAYDKVKAGTIVPPSNFSEETVDNFTGLK
jgi:basic membrane protein A and related proteins